MTPGLGVKAGGRLVQEDQLRIADQRQGQVQATPLPARQLLGALVALLGELDKLEDLVHRALARVVAAEHLDQFIDRQVGLHAALLQHDADLFAEVSGARGRVDAQDARLPRRARPVALQYLYVVVLPAPLGPSKQKTSPRLTSKLTPPTARVSP